MSGCVDPAADVAVDGEVRRRLERRFGDAVEGWLDGLPARLATLRDRWGLELDGVIPRGSMSVVLRCRTADGRRAVLKVAPDLERLAGETAALRHWAGVRVPQVLEADTEVGALLLEEVEPGTPLAASGHLPEPAELAALLAGLHRHGSPAAPFPPLSTRIAYLFESWRGPRGRDPALAELVRPELLDRGRQLAQRLDQDARSRVLLHGDLTPVNVLEGGEERGLVCIDPAPCVGDPAFDAVDLVLWQARTSRSISERTHALGRATGLRPQRLLSWCAAFAAMAAMDVAQASGPDRPEIAVLLALAGHVPG